MKDIRAALRALMLSDAAVSSAVGGNRIYPGVLPQGQKSASVVQNLISELTDYHMQGASGLAEVRIQVDCWAGTQDAAVDLANKVKDAISGVSGAQAYGSNSPQDSVTIHGIFADSARDDYDSEAQLHRRGRDYRVSYWEN